MKTRSSEVIMSSHLLWLRFVTLVLFDLWSPHMYTACSSVSLPQHLVHNTFNIPQISFEYKQKNSWWCRVHFLDFLKSFFSISICYWITWRKNNVMRNFRTHRFGGITFSKLKILKMWYISFHTHIWCILIPGETDGEYNPKVYDAVIFWKQCKPLRSTGPDEIGRLAR